MKKLILLIGALLLAVTLPSSVLAAPVEKVVFQPGNNKYIINDTEFTMDAVPFISEGRTYVPLRFLASALGVEDKLIGWDKSTGTVSLAFRSDNYLDIILQTGNRQLIINYLHAESNELLNSKIVSMDVTPVLRNGRVYLPARWIAEACGFTVEWDGDQNVLICAPDTKEPSTGGVSVDTRQIKITTDWLKLNMQIPVISGMANKTLQEDINKEILDKAMHTKSELENNYAEYAAAASEYNFPAQPFELYVTYEAYTSGSVLSLVIETYQYSGGAHGLTWRDYYNLDTQNGRRLSLHELFKDDVDYVNIINREIKKQIADQIKSGQGLYFEGDMGFQSISENHPYYIKDNYIVLCFGAYEIAPYAAGMPEFRIPINLLSKQLREDILNLLTD